MDLSPSNYKMLNFVNYHGLERCKNVSMELHNSEEVTMKVRSCKMCQESATRSPLCSWLCPWVLLCNRPLTLHWLSPSYLLQPQEIIKISMKLVINFHLQASARDCVTEPWVVSNCNMQEIKQLTIQSYNYPFSIVLPDLDAKKCGMPRH